MSLLWRGFPGIGGGTSGEGTNAAGGKGGRDNGRYVSTCIAERTGAAEEGDLLPCGVQLDVGMILGGG